MPPVRFEPTVSADERSQTYVLDRAATGTGKCRLMGPQKRDQLLHYIDWLYSYSDTTGDYSRPSPVIYMFLFCLLANIKCCIELSKRFILSYSAVCLWINTTTCEGEWNYNFCGFLIKIELRLYLCKLIVTYVFYIQCLGSLLRVLFKG